MTWNDVMHLPPLKSSKFWPRPPKWEMIFTFNGPYVPSPSEWGNRYAPDAKTGTNSSPADPCWDLNDLGDKWRRHHFIYLVVEGLKRAKVKPLNYSQVTSVQQGLMNLPLLFYSILKTQFKNIPQEPEKRLDQKELT
jgi:hypothetical protein